jgi:hypothetical protein
MWIERLRTLSWACFSYWEPGNLGISGTAVLGRPFALRCGTVGVTVGVTLAVTVWSLLWDAWSSLDAHMSSVRRCQVSEGRNLAV